MSDTFTRLRHWDLERLELVNQNTMGNLFVGSASCVAPAGSKLVGSVNEVNASSTKDAFLVYEGTNP